MIVIMLNAVEKKMAAETAAEAKTEEGESGEVPAAVAVAEVSATSWGKKVAEQFSLQPSSYQKMSSTEGEVGASPDALLSRLRVLEMLDSATEDAQRPPQLKIRHETEDSPTGASWEGSSHSLEVLAA